MRIGDMTFLVGHPPCMIPHNLRLRAERNGLICRGIASTLLVAWMKRLVSHRLRGEEAMLDGVLLLTGGLLLGLYAAHELAPTWWATAAALLRRFATVSPPRPATLREAVLVPDQDRSSAIGTGPRPTQPSGALAPERKTRRVVIVVAPLAVMALAFALRMVKITESPYGFFCDEASNALDAY